MNPIHESGFASLVVLFFAACPGALAAFVALVLSWKHPRKATIAANAALILSALVCVFAAIITMRLHSRVDYWIDTGGYGPPADVRAKYGAEWHDSAHFTAWIGLFLTALPLIVSGIVHFAAYRKEAKLRPPIEVFVIAAAAIFFCLIMAIL
jgi:hypothetical protein